MVILTCSNLDTDESPDLHNLIIYHLHIMSNFLQLLFKYIQTNKVARK